MRNLLFAVGDNVRRLSSVRGGQVQGVQEARELVLVPGYRSMRTRG